MMELWDFEVQRFVLRFDRVENILSWFEIVNISVFRHFETLYILINSVVSHNYFNIIIKIIERMLMALIPYDRKISVIFKKGWK